MRLADLPLLQARTVRSVRAGGGAALLLLFIAAAARGSGTPVVPGGGATSELITQQGSGAPTNFGDYISAAGGLDSPYSYYVEVPAGISCLAIDIFDADLGAGTDDLSSQRDRPRGAFNTSVAYSLTDPSGTPVATSFTLGNAAGPGDNAWLSLYRSSSGSLGTFGDTFPAVSYSNDTGSLAWAGPWTETGDDGSPSSGDILVTGGQLSLRNAVRSITRSANLAAQSACQAVLSFDIDDVGTLEGNDCIDVEVSGDGGASFAVLERFCDDIPGTSASYDLSTFIASDTRIRFTAASGLAGGGEAFVIDNVQIELFGAATAAAGHWEVEVDTSSAVTTGDDVNAFGIRAHDGNPGAGGTELEIYSDSFYTIGINSGSRTYDVFPWVTSGCSGGLNNFDWDATSSPFGSIDLASRLGAFTVSATTSANDTWNSEPFTGWTDDVVVDDYGIWNLQAVIDDTGTANFGAAYVGSDLAAPPPPSSQPEPQTFRIYLPTDAGGAPEKPYLAQFLTHLQGANPPSVGSTSTLQVTVRLTHPAGAVGNIVFSTPSNVVTANVPGGDVVYAGGAAVSSGTIVSQPAIGGSGDVVWNPGTVAPGSIEILTYRLDVTPSIAGTQPVTGDVGSTDGTRGRWLDETGNTAQARATFDFGELCPLRVTTGLLTHAVVSRFDLIDDGTDVVIEWETRSEAGTLGFALFRSRPELHRWVQIHDDMLVGLLDSPQGGIYRFRDVGALSGGGRPEYALVEIDSAGRRTPVETSPRWLDPGSAPRPAVDDYERIAHHLPPPRPSLAPSPSLRPLSGAFDEKGLGRRRAKVTTSAAGITFVSTDDLSIALGESPRAVRQRLERYGYAMTSRGREVSWLAAQDGAGLYFYSEAIDGPYSDENVYWLDRGQGRPMGQRLARAPLSLPAETFVDVRHEEVDATPVLVLPLAADSDFWFWGGLRSGTSATFSVQAPGVAGTGRATLSASLQGATDSGTADEHHIEILLNGAWLGETSWSGIRAHTVSFEVDAAMLLEADNVVEVRGIQDPGAPQSIVFVDSFDLGYERRFVAVGGELAFAPGAGSSISIGGFPGPDLLLFEIADPASPTELVGFPIAAAGSTYGLAFAPDRPAARHVALSREAVHEPTRVEGRPEVLLVGSHLEVDYLLIAHPSLLDGAERLAEARRRRGLRSLVLQTDDVYDALSDGIQDPRALRGLLIEATSRRRGPRYVTLVGTGTFDYRDLLGQGDNLVPPLLVSTENGLFASDNRLADIDGDGRPEIAIGRLPVRDGVELDDFVDKLLSYEATIGDPWHSRVTLAADRPSQGVRFEVSSEGAAALLPSSVAIERIYLASEALAPARARLLAQLAEGVSVVHFLGHGGIDRIGVDGLLLASDVPALSNGSRLPLVTALTCVVNRFEIPGLGALGEELVRHPGGGAVAVWSASGLSNHFEAAALGELFLSRLSRRQRGPLGDVVLDALRHADGSLANLYVLLGDPTTEIDLARP